MKRDAERLAAFEDGERAFGAAKVVAMVHSRMYDMGLLYGLSGVQDGVEVVLPVWKIQYRRATATGQLIECRDFLGMERVATLHMTVLCPLLGALLTWYPTRASIV